MIGRDYQIPDNVEDTKYQQIGWVESDRESDSACLLFAGEQSVDLGISSTDQPVLTEYSIRAGPRGGIG